MDLKEAKDYVLPKRVIDYSPRDYAARGVMSVWEKCEVDICNWANSPKPEKIEDIVNCMTQREMLAVSNVVFGKSFRGGQGTAKIYFTSILKDEKNPLGKLLLHGDPGIKCM